MNNFARAMGLLFGSAGAHTYPKSGQVAPPPPSVFTMSVNMKFACLRRSPTIGDF